MIRASPGGGRWAFGGRPVHFNHRCPDQLVSARTRAAFAAKKAQGVKLGNPRDMHQAAAKGREAQRAAADQFAANALPIRRLDT
jgi:hypothetical protein